MSNNTTVRVKKHRDHLRASGLKPVQIWVPDTKRDGFREECNRQSLLCKSNQEEIALMNNIESLVDFRGWI